MGGEQANRRVQRRFEKRGKRDERVQKSMKEGKDGGDSVRKPISRCGGMIVESDGK